ncbi:hypothetical protein [Gluconacetobacter johannae]|uniref:Uncharacterized protein n=1 Tax=Gluconacetobacter johannae TaxID=112140 RepID=A0A7W4P4E4_9PROT|nr:hypothetical protein [Gluconacetobacter johannae]MBB2177161.1 hypothetical protein [Gluconacetobacter johannae]
MARHPLPAPPSERSGRGTDKKLIEMKPSVAQRRKKGKYSAMGIFNLYARNCAEKKRRNKYFLFKDTFMQISLRHNILVNGNAYQ